MVSDAVGSAGVGRDVFAEFLFARPSEVPQNNVPIERRCGDLILVGPVPVDVGRVERLSALSSDSQQLAYLELDSTVAQVDQFEHWGKETPRCTVVSVESSLGFSDRCCSAGQRI